MRSEKDWQLTENYQIKPDDRVRDMRKAYNAKNISELPDFFSPVEYFQIFGKAFVPNLSVLDLLFCEGPGARLILRDSYLSE